MNKTDKLDFTALAWYLTGNAVIKGILYYFVFVFTRLMSVTDYGQYSVYLVYENLLTSIIGLGFSQTVKPALKAWGEEYPSYLKSVCLYTLGCGFAVLLLLVVNARYWLESIQSPVWVCLLLWGNALANCFYFLMSQNCVARNKYRHYILIEAFRSVPQLFLALAVLSYLPSVSGFHARLFGHTIPLMLLGTCCLVLFMRKGHAASSYLSYSLSMGVPLILVGLSQTILSQSDQLIIQQYWGNEGTGFYAAISYVGSILYVIMLSIQNCWDPWFYQNYQTADSSCIQQWMQRLLFGFTLIICLMMTFGPEMASFFLDQAYQNAIPLLYPIACSWLFAFMGCLIMNVEYAHKNTVFAAAGTMIGAALNLLLNFIFVPVYGYPAAAWTTLVSYVVIFIWHSAIEKALFRSGLFSLGKMLFCILLAAVILCIGILFYQSASTRIPLSLLVLVFSVFLFRKRLL